MDVSDRIRFDPLIAGRPALHCYLDEFYVARIMISADACTIDGPAFPYCTVPDVEHAKEVVRMWVRRRST